MKDTTIFSNRKEEGARAPLSHLEAFRRWLEHVGFTQQQTASLGRPVSCFSITFRDFASFHSFSSKIPNLPPCPPKGEVLLSSITLDALFKPYLNCAATIAHNMVLKQDTVIGSLFNAHCLKAQACSAALVWCE